jgi:hypothetical protein
VASCPKCGAHKNVKRKHGKRYCSRCGPWNQLTQQELPKAMMNFKCIVRDALGVAIASFSLIGYTNYYIMERAAEQQASRIALSHKTLEFVRL